LIIQFTTSSTLPFELVVSDGTTGLTVTVKFRDSTTADSFLDFNDGVFKTSGWTNQTLTLTSIGDGFYRNEYDISLATLPVVEFFVGEYLITGAITGSATEMFQNTEVSLIPAASDGSNFRAWCG